MSDRRNSPSLKSWLSQGYHHCHHGTKEWCTEYLNGAAARIATLEAENARLREALQPFANALIVYGEFPEHQLILLSEDNPKGRRLAHLRPENFDAACAALGDTHD